MIGVLKKVFLRFSRHAQMNRTMLKYFSNSVCVLIKSACRRGKYQRVCRELLTRSVQIVCEIISHGNAHSTLIKTNTMRKQKVNYPSK